MNFINSDYLNNLIKNNSFLIKEEEQNELKKQIVEELDYFVFLLNKIPNKICKDHYYSNSFCENCKKKDVFVEKSSYLLNKRWSALKAILSNLKEENVNSDSEEEEKKNYTILLEKSILIEKSKKRVFELTFLKTSIEFELKYLKNINFFWNLLSSDNIEKEEKSFTLKKILKNINKNLKEKKNI